MVELESARFLRPSDFKSLSKWLSYPTHISTICWNKSCNSFKYQKIRLKPNIYVSPASYSKIREGIGETFNYPTMSKKSKYFEIHCIEHYADIRKILSMEGSIPGFIRKFCVCTGTYIRATRTYSRVSTWLLAVSRHCGTSTALRDSNTTSTWHLYCMARTCRR